MTLRKGGWVYLLLLVSIPVLAGLIYLKTCGRKLKKALPKTELQFSAERVEMRITGREVRLKGCYYFRNNSPQKSIRRLLFYPFPVDSTHNSPYTISVYYLPSGKKITYGLKEKLIYFPVDLPPHSTTAVVVEYRQFIQAKSAKYILHTTEYWGRPLERAEFLIWVPKGFRDVQFSYSPTEVETLRSQVKFTIKRRNFLPRRDLEIRWK